MLNKALLFARYAGYLTLCLRAALFLQVVRLKDKTLSSEELSNVLGIDAYAGRSFFNVLVSLGIMENRNAGYSLSADAAQLLSVDTSFSLAPYFMIGLEQDSALSDFVSFLKDPKRGTALYAVGGERSLMDEPDGIAKNIAYGLASRAKRFAHLLATSIAKRVSHGSAILDLGAGSPFLAEKLVSLITDSAITMADHANAARFITSLAKENGIEIQAGELRANQIGLTECNIFNRETLPRANTKDAVIFSNVLHDWSPVQIPTIIQNAGACLKRNGIIVVHEAFLGGENAQQQQWMAAYGMGLNQLTQGQGSCYSIEEYDQHFRRAGYSRNERPVETTDGCQALFYQQVC